MFMSFFRYPGGKRKLSKTIVKKLNAIAGNKKVEYREPFFGGGSVGLCFLQHNPNIERIWINDFNQGISSLWTSVINYPNLLCNQILDFTPSLEDFYNFKQYLTDIAPALDTPEKIANYGFRKLAIHQISYSGLGTKSGGPLGGKDQTSQYKIDCRWSPNTIIKKINALNCKLSKIEIRDKCCTSHDFSKLIEDSKHPAIIYLDPPYYDKGSELYQDGFKEEDHIRLSECLKNSKHSWLLSYDDCPAIRKLYDWANIEDVNVNYSITATINKETGETESRTKPELLISK